MANPDVQPDRQAQSQTGTRTKNKRKGAPAARPIPSDQMSYTNGNVASKQQTMAQVGSVGYGDGVGYASRDDLPIPAVELSFSDEDSSFDDLDQPPAHRRASPLRQKRPRGDSREAASYGRDPNEIINAAISNHLHLPKPSLGVSHNTVKTIARSARDNSLWNTSTLEERGRIKEFWLSLSEEERKSLLKIEKDAVLRKMKEQQKHSCSCTVCGRKRTAIEEELEALYDAYYDELEQYANVRQQAAIPSPHPPPPPTPPPPAQRLPSPPRRLMYSDTHVRHPRPVYSDHTRPAHPLVDSDVQSGHRANNRIREVLDLDDESDQEDDGRHDNIDEEVYSEYDDEDSYEDDGDGYEMPSDSVGAGFFDFGNSLTVKGGILTVADDLLQNDGRKFIDMMEQLAERRMQREHEIDHHNSQPVHHPPPLDMPLAEDDDYEDDEDYDSQEEYEQDYEVDEMGGMSEEQRMEEGRRMFQIFAARMFEQRVLTAYRERVAAERQRKLLEELDDDAKLSEQRKNKKQKDAEKKKNKKQAQRAAKAEAQAAKEKAKAEQEAAAKAAQEAAAREQREKKEAQKREAQEKKRRQDEERKLKEAEKAQQRRLELEEREAKAFKLKEQKALEKKLREEKEREEREERAAKAKALEIDRSTVEAVDAGGSSKPSPSPDNNPAPAPQSGPPAGVVRQSSKTASPATAVATPVMPKAMAANRVRQPKQNDARVAPPAGPTAATSQRHSPANLDGAVRSDHTQSKQAPPPSQLPPHNNFPGPIAASLGGPHGLSFGMHGTPTKPVARQQPSHGFALPVHQSTQTNHGRGNVVLPHPPGFPAADSASTFQPSLIGVPVSQEHIGFASNQSRPTPIQRPSSFAQPRPDEDDSNRLLGSSALLDGADEPLPRMGDRKFSNPPGMGRAAPLGFSPPLYTSLPGPGSFHAAPPHWSTASTLPHGADASMWGMPMSSGMGWSSSGFGASSRPSNANRPLTIRLAVCQACRQLSQRTSPDAFHDIQALSRQMELNGVLHTAPPTLREIEEICETEGDAHNGGGLLSFRQTGENSFAVRFDEGSPTSMMSRTSGAQLGEIGSPVSPPSHSGQQRAFGKLGADLAPGAGGFQAKIPTLQSHRGDC